MVMQSIGRCSSCGEIGVISDVRPALCEDCTAPGPLPFEPVSNDEGTCPSCGGKHPACGMLHLG